jgi:hypothetical protein
MLVVNCCILSPELLPVGSLIHLSYSSLTLIPPLICLQCSISLSRLANQKSLLGFPDRECRGIPALTRPSLGGSPALHITGLDLESTATIYPGDGFRRVQRFSHLRMGKAIIR